MKKAKPKGMSRREFLKAACVAGGLGAMPYPLHAWAPPTGSGKGRFYKGRKLVILGIDGTDPRMLASFMDKGLLPNFSRLTAQGGLTSVQTTMPPQSPVAWSTFISGLDPGGHGIFDFVHRRPDAVITPYFSMSRSSAPEKKLSIGSWEIPLSTGKVEQLRQGRAFWQILEDHGIPTMVVKMPANFPPVPSRGFSLSGMGTPDLVGSMGGQFSLFTEDPPKGFRSFSGGVVYPVRLRAGRLDAVLVGPDNTFRQESKTSYSEKKRPPVHPKLEAPFSVFVDPENPVAKITLNTSEFILQEGEWSDWVQVTFPAVPGLVQVHGICRFLLQSVRPVFKLYVSPLQIDPQDPALPISTPPDWAAAIADEIGPFYTQGLPADTKALTHGVLSPDEFWDLTQFILKERQRLLDFSLRRFKDGCLFFYVSTLDESCHMLWRFTDPSHPAHVDHPTLRNSIQKLYVQMDQLLGEIMDRVDGHTDIMVISDHGFSPFNWGMNLNSWLAENDFIQRKNPLWHQGANKLWQDVDWTHSTCYAAGLNGLYLNLKGREKNGIIQPGNEADDMLDQIAQSLLNTRDPRTGQHPVSKIVFTHREYAPDCLAWAPDLIIGFNKGYRISWESPLGEFAEHIYNDNVDAWSADHCVDSDCVPATLATNLSITHPQPALQDLTVSVLNYFGIHAPGCMQGHGCLV